MLICCCLWWWWWYLPCHATSGLIINISTQNTASHHHQAIDFYYVPHLLPSTHTTAYDKLYTSNKKFNLDPREQLSHHQHFYLEREEKKENLPLTCFYAWNVFMLLILLYCLCNVKVYFFWRGNHNVEGKHFYTHFFGGCLKMASQFFLSSKKRNI